MHKKESKEIGGGRNIYANRKEHIRLRKLYEMKGIDMKR